MPWDSRWIWVTRSVSIAWRTIGTSGAPRTAFGAGRLLEQIHRSPCDRELVLQLADPFPRGRQLAVLLRAQPGGKPAADAILLAPGVDRLIAEVEVVRDTRHAATLGEQVENLASKLGRVAPSSQQLRTRSPARGQHPVRRPHNWAPTGRSSRSNAPCTRLVTALR